MAGITLKVLETKSRESWHVKALGIVVGVIRIVK